MKAKKVTVSFVCNVGMEDDLKGVLLEAFEGADFGLWQENDPLVEDVEVSGKCEEFLADDLDLL
jgi:hypothetical protein